MPFQLAELARRFPDTPFIMGHGGAGDHLHTDAVPVMELASNIYFETSKQGPHLTLRVLNANPEWAERILFGSNLPWSSYPLELNKIPMVVEDPDVREAIMGGNMAHLLLQEV